MDHENTTKMQTHRLHQSGNTWRKNTAELNLTNKTREAKLDIMHTK